MVERKASKDTEIDITPEMIEAGKLALGGWSLIDDEWGVIAVSVYEAMETAKRAGCHRETAF